MATKKEDQVGLDPLRIGYLMTDAEIQERIRERVSEEYRRMLMLAESLGIRNPEQDWYAVALELARRYIPELKTNKNEWRPTKWGMFETAMLCGEFLRVTTERGVNTTEAANILSTQEPWKSFVERWGDGANHYGADPAEALRTQYKKAKKTPHHKLGEGAFRGCMATGGIEEWEALVGLILGNK